VNLDLAEVDDRWPQVAPKARTAGYRRTHALPMRLRERIIGAVNILDPADRELDLADLAIAQSMADVATIGILQRWAIEQATELAQQLQTALNSRVVIEQAKGIVAEKLHVSIPEAFEILRSHARNASRRLSDVAQDVIAGRLPATGLVHS
jgi:GAF domain-containing protein